MICAVIDTNVIVSALLTRHADSATARILDAITSGVIKSVCSSEILQEYRDVLARRKFGFSPEKIADVLAVFEEDSLMLDGKHSDEEFPDEKDRVFYEVALAAHDEDVTTRLVTGNLKHFPKSVVVVTPAEFCELAGI